MIMMMSLMMVRIVDSGAIADDDHDDATYNGHYIYVENENDQCLFPAC